MNFVQPASASIEITLYEMAKTKIPIEIDD